MPSIRWKRQSKNVFITKTHKRHVEIVVVRKYRLLSDSSTATPGPSVMLARKLSALYRGLNFRIADDSLGRRQIPKKPVLGT